jgi:dienelactone hydrolase
MVPADFVPSQDILRRVNHRGEQLRPANGELGGRGVRLPMLQDSVEPEPNAGTSVTIAVERAGPSGDANASDVPAATRRRSERRWGVVRVQWVAARHVRLAAATAIAGVALAVLTGHDGSPRWQIVRVLAVAALTAAAVAMESRLGDRACGRLAAALGVIALAVGAGFVPYLVKDGPSIVAAAGVVDLVAGIGLAVAGTVVGTRGQRASRQIGAGVGTVAAAVIVIFVVAPAVAATNVPHPDLGATPASRGLDYETLTLTTDDGVRLAGWYLPSTNRAAVVLLHGAGSTRSDVVDEAAVLARHGFGVLLLDARGHGHSGGRAMDFGWHGDSDIAAATGYLANRPDVDPQRLGVVGMSMGGEEALGATATNNLIRAVVAEGATARSAADEAWLSDEYGLRGLLQEQLEHAQDWVTDSLTSASVPTSNRAAVEASGDIRYLLITAGDVPDEGHAAAHVAAGAPDRVQTWTVRGAGHTEGLETQPDEWEGRVIAFLTDALGGNR